MPKNELFFYLAALNDLFSEKLLPVHQTCIIQVKTSLFNDINSVTECKLSKPADYTKLNTQLICGKGGMHPEGPWQTRGVSAWESRAVQQRGQGSHQYEQSLWKEGIESSPAGDLGMKHWTWASNVPWLPRKPVVSWLWNEAPTAVLKGGSPASILLLWHFPCSPVLTSAAQFWIQEIHGPVRAGPEEGHENGCWNTSPAKTGWDTPWGEFIVAPYI